MFFSKKDKTRLCENCGSKTEKKNDFCPRCGNSFIDAEQEQEDFGLLGRDDFTSPMQNPAANLGITDRLFSSIFNNLVKTLDRQFQSQLREMERDEGAEIRALPNGIRIKISNSPNKKHKKEKARNKAELTEEQIKKMSSLPRAKAKSSLKRFGDKLVYEISAPGVGSTEDIFISRLESGYEIKAIGSKKVYVNSIPISLPLQKYSILNNKIFFEFSAHSDNDFEE